MSILLYTYAGVHSYGPFSDYCWVVGAFAEGSSNCHRRERVRRGFFFGCGRLIGRLHHVQSFLETPHRTVFLYADHLDEDLQSVVDKRDLK